MRTNVNTPELDNTLHRFSDGYFEGVAFTTSGIRFEMTFGSIVYLENGLFVHNQSGCIEKSSESFAPALLACLGVKVESVTLLPKQSLDIYLANGIHIRASIEDSDYQGPEILHIRTGEEFWVF
jgi:hypothetical protein